MAAVKMKYEIVGQCGRAKSAHMETVHGVIETPVFMNVGTPPLRAECPPTTFGLSEHRWSFPIPIIFM